MYCTVRSGCLLSPLYYPNMMHIKFLLPTALIKQPTRSQELPYDICLPMQGKVKKLLVLWTTCGRSLPTQSSHAGLPTSFLANSYFVTLSKEMSLAIQINYVGKGTPYQQPIKIMSYQLIVYIDYVIVIL